MLIDIRRDEAEDIIIMFDSHRDSISYNMIQLCNDLRKKFGMIAYEDEFKDEIVIGRVYPYYKAKIDGELTCPMKVMSVLDGGVFCIPSHFGTSDLKDENVVAMLFYTEVTFRKLYDIKNGNNT